MFVYLDTCIVIYSVEGHAPFRQRAQTHIAAVEAAGYRFFQSLLELTVGNPRLAVLLHEINLLGITSEVDPAGANLLLNFLRYLKTDGHDPLPNEPSSTLSQNTARTGMYLSNSWGNFLSASICSFSNRS
jgi:hypothetical protein